MTSPLPTDRYYVIYIYIYIHIQQYPKHLNITLPHNSLLYISIQIYVQNTSPPPIVFTDLLSHGLIDNMYRLGFFTGHFSNQHHKLASYLGLHQKGLICTHLDCSRARRAGLFKA